MKTPTLIALSAGLLLCSGSAIAGWSIDFVRITCIPEARYFRFDYTPVSGSAALLETALDGKKRSQRMLAWKKHGYYEATNLQYECRWPESTYKISAVQAPARERGMCMAAPQIKLSLFRNGIPILDKVIFGNDCFGGPTVVSAEITDGLQGWDTRQMTICFSPKEDAPRICEFLSETYDAISKAVPINQIKVDEYVKEYR